MVAEPSVPLEGSYVKQRLKWTDMRAPLVLFCVHSRNSRCRLTCVSTAGVGWRGRCGATATLISLQAKLTWMVSMK